MKISNVKNLAFSDQSSPLPSKEVPSAFEAQRARAPLRTIPIDASLIIPSSGDPKVEMRIEKRSEDAYELRLQIENFEVGQHVFPPAMKIVSVKALGDRSPNFSTALETESFLPDHLGLQPVPRELPEELRRPPFIRAYPSQKDRKRGSVATTIFPPDDRSTFNDTRYPWSTCGRVDSPGGFGSGVMVGPRHLLTASHMIQWNADGTAGWVRFRPSFFDGSAPFGEAWGVTVYSKMKVSGPTIDVIEGMYDYVVVVLDRNLGNVTGWMGAKGYTDGWDGGAFWTHVGYPGDIAGGNRPTFQNAIPLDGYWWEVDSHEAMSHTGDVWPGQSGGPFFGWWAGQPGPYAVAVQSSQNAGENNASGGQDMVDLILHARSDNP